MQGFYPSRTKAFDLPIHRHIEEPKRPRFYARFITRKERLELTELVRSATQDEDKGDFAAATKKLDTAISRLIDGAENVPEAFDLKEASKSLDAEDCWALYAEGMAAIAVTRDELKKSASPSPSEAKPSVPSAPAAATVQ